MKTTFTQLLAEETGIENDVQTALRVGLITDKQIEAAADKYAELKMAEFAEFLRLNYQNSPLEFDNYWEDIRKFPKQGKSYTTAELIQIFNAENNGR